MEVKFEIDCGCKVKKPDHCDGLGINCFLIECEWLLMKEQSS